ncbi:hypothetical protein RKD27_007433 [Streptomyces sp. SAI-126]|uniref:hypothetical protein n=1 Tax=unclassified Streptomyces TaxID=2593676 RepID=UPI000F4F61C0
METHIFEGVGEPGGAGELGAEAFNPCAPLLRGSGAVSSPPSRASPTATGCTPVVRLLDL